MSVNRRDFVAAVGLSALASAGARAATPTARAVGLGESFGLSVVLSSSTCPRSLRDRRPVSSTTRARWRRRCGPCAQSFRDHSGDHANNL